ncbi:MAG: hypothetical protein ACLR56_14700 [Oscillospiraceae bacterium]
MGRRLCYPSAALPKSCRFGCFITVKMTDLDGNEVAGCRKYLQKKRRTKSPEPLEVTETEFEITAEGEGFAMYFQSRPIF